VPVIAASLVSPSCYRVKTEAALITMSDPIFAFAQSSEILTPLAERYGCGWFDGGCYIFARALQIWLGGSLAVLVREELLDEQAFDHVVLRLGNSPDCVKALYIDADGVATRRTLLERWQTRERLKNVQLEDPADTIRFVGHLRNESLSTWLAKQLQLTFGNHDRMRLTTSDRGGPMTTISGDSRTVAGFNAGKYIARIRSETKKQYARAYLTYILNGRRRSCPSRGVLSKAAAQAVRRRLEKIFHETPS